MLLSFSNHLILLSVIYVFIFFRCSVTSFSFFPFPISCMYDYSFLDLEYGQFLCVRGAGSVENCKDKRKEKLKARE